MNANYPAFGICGYSGSGKTTLIESLLPLLKRRGLAVAVVKHDIHGLNIDHEGKDTDRFFKAGADVFVNGPEQSFFRSHGRDDRPLENLLGRIGAHYDLILVEGHKSTPLKRKIWLSGETREDPPPEAVNIQQVLSRDDDRMRITMNMIDAWLPRAWRSTPVYGGILIGGQSSRFGSPKHLVKEHEGSWLEHTFMKTEPWVDKVVLLGAAEVPAAVDSVLRLPDAPDKEGPLAGMLSAMRWNPSASWIFIPCDLPLLCGEALKWLLEQREPGKHAIFPQLQGKKHPEPMLAYYDFRSAPLLEKLNRPADLTLHGHLSTPLVPDRLRSSWHNVNTKEELIALRSRNILSTS